MKIKQYLLGIILAFVLLTSGGASLPDLATVKKQLMAYHDSGQYYRQIDAEIREAVYYLQFRLNQNSRLKNKQKLAVVLDIDETALSNYSDMLHLNFGGTLAEIVALGNQSHAPAIPGVQTFYRYALQHHVAVFFVTGRREFQREATVRNLKMVGYTIWDGLFMRSAQQQTLSAASFKMAVRKQISKLGYDIVLNIGDQTSDLDGGYADMIFKLPNPYYRVD